MSTSLLINRDSISKLRIRKLLLLQKTKNNTRPNVADLLLFVVLPESRLLIQATLVSIAQSFGAVISCRLILQLRACLREGDVRCELLSMSVGSTTQLQSIAFADGGGDKCTTGGASTPDDSDLPESDSEVGAQDENEKSLPQT